MEEEPAGYFIGGPINKDVIALPYPMGRNDNPVNFQASVFENGGLQRFAYFDENEQPKPPDTVEVWYWPQPFYTEEGYRVWIIGEEPVMA